MKQCRRCQKVKSYLEFDKKTDCIGGVVSTCKVCRKERQDERKEIINAQRRANYQKDSSIILDRNFKYQQNHKEEIAEYQSNYGKQNREALREYHRDYSVGWREDNRAHVNAKSNAYRAAKIKATPPWLTETHKQQTLMFYEAATALTKELGKPFEVDHIMPLKGKTSSGLHVPWNLQVLPMPLNRAKGNKTE